MGIPISGAFGTMQISTERGWPDIMLIPTGTRKAGLRKFRNPPPHNVLNNHYKPLIKLNYNDSLELAPQEQGKKNTKIS